MATVVLTPEAVRDLGDLPRPILARIDGLLQRLREWPNLSGAKPLRREMAGKFRLRTGDYRLQFHVERERRIEKVQRIVKKKTIIEEQEVVEIKVIVEKVGHRDGFYDE
jgi:mRNA-degrading endonuclease RelE of RelBE toxin-antitoxin system